jgi:guanylate kinase
VLAERLRGRGTESPEALARRLAKAQAELSQRDAYDHVVTNDTVKSACAHILTIVAAS